MCYNIINPGLAPWAMQEYRPLGAHCPTTPINSTKQYNHNQIQKHKRNNSFKHPNTFNEHNTTTQHRKRPIRQRALQGRHSCKAQGEIRAKPDMKPWGNTANPTKSPARATPLQSSGRNEGKARYETLGKHSQYDKEPCKGDTPAKPRVE